MIVLEKEVRSRGFEYSQVKRWDCKNSKKGIAIYIQKSEGIEISYEVMVIQKQFKDEKGPGDVIYKAKERFPSDSMWSTHGWTMAFFKDKEGALQRALAKFEELKLRIQENG